MITTREALREYITNRLGAPYIRVELTEAQLDIAIDAAIDKFTKFSYTGQIRDIIVTDLASNNNEKDFHLDPEIDEVIYAKTASGGGMYTLETGGLLVKSDYQPMYSMMGADISAFSVAQANMSLIDNLFNVDLNYTWNAPARLLSFHETPKGKILLYVAKLYVPKPIDAIYNYDWVKNYAYSKSKFIWGSVTGKMEQTLISGANINYGDMKSEAETEIQFLEEELLNRYQMPAPILVC